MTEWTIEKKVRATLRLPWTIIRENDPDDGSVVLRAAEIPGVIGVGEDGPSATDDFWQAFALAIEALIAAGDRIPLPRGVRTYPWLQPVAMRVQPARVQVSVTNPRGSQSDEQTAGTPSDLHLATA